MPTNAKIISSMWLLRLICVPSSHPLDYFLAPSLRAIKQERGTVKGGILADEVGGSGSWIMQLM